MSDKLRNAIPLKAGEMGYLKLRNPSDYKILALHQKPFMQDNSNYSRMLQDIAQALQKTGCEYDMEYGADGAPPQSSAIGIILRLS